MDSLILLRHAQALPQTIDGNDYDRPLSNAGRLEAQRSARRLLDVGLIPDRILASPSLRTAETTALLLPVLGLPSTMVRYEPGLYLASVTKLKEVIARSGAGSGRLLLVGHNPGLSTLAATLLRQRGLRLATAEFREIVQS